MLVKLKCIDNCGIEYITTGKVYEAVKLCIFSYVYELQDDTNYRIAVSTDNTHNNDHGKWEVVNEDC